jgi:NAD(P)-dependent dehydrogenase (short-subunit alcohol dehydrogenase family)
MTLRAKRAVIIGGTSGIGFAVAEAARAAHAEVVVVSRKQENVDNAIKRLSNGAKGFAVDVRNESEVASFFERLGAFDHLVFTAGDWDVMAAGPLPELDLAKASQIFSVRFWGAVTVVKHAQKLISSGGSITLTDGMVAHRPRKGAALSTAMAGAVEHLTRGLAMELAPVRVNAVCPGMIRTEVWNSIPEDKREERFRRSTERQPIARIGEPSEVAEAYLYLMQAGYTTGQVLHVEGGSGLI